jgi:hypothetical protein
MQLPPPHTHMGLFYVSMLQAVVFSIESRSNN